MIDTALSLGLPEPVETYSSSEHLYELLNIPQGSNGRMTKAKPAVREERPASKKAEVKKESAPRQKRERVRTKRIAE